MTTATAAVKVQSSAIDSMGIADGQLLVTFNSNPDKVYLYGFRDSEILTYWDSILTDEQFGDRDPNFSWGKALHQGLKSGELVKVEV